MNSDPANAEVIPRILLVDDNPDGLLVRRSLLEEVGYCVHIASNGEGRTPVSGSSHATWLRQRSRTLGPRCVRARQGVTFYQVAAPAQQRAFVRSILRSTGGKLGVPLG